MNIRYTGQHNSSIKTLWVLFDTTFRARFRLRKVLENAVLRPSRGDSPAPGQSRGTRLVTHKNHIFLAKKLIVFLVKKLLNTSKILKTLRPYSKKNPSKTANLSRVDLVEKCPKISPGTCTTYTRLVKKSFGNITKFNEIQQWRLKSRVFSRI